MRLRVHLQAQQDVSGYELEQELERELPQSPSNLRKSVEWLGEQWPFFLFTEQPSASLHNFAIAGTNWDQIASSAGMQVLVLNSSAWPFSQSGPFTMPAELEGGIAQFRAFYDAKHQGRNLIWMPQLCKGEVQTGFSKKPYVIQASVFQIAVLLQFNESPSYTTEELRTNTALDLSTLRGILSILVKAHLVEEAEERYTVNENYRNKKFRININVPIKEEQKQEAEQTQQSVEEDRKLTIQACLVRVMKARKRLKHNDLIQEAINQLSSRFQPKIPLIKKCIDLLIEKEFLERPEGAIDEYCYLA
eukprot:m.498374 g.498374  ORF g.498374 m.498374 type:complete len:305 (+) comp57316_c0_seq24:1460-2374(+)